MGRQELEDFLGDRYPDEKKLRAFVSYTFGKKADKAIGWGSGLANACNELITWIESKGDVAKLWPALLDDLPNYAEEIAKHQAAWVDPPKDPEPEKRTPASFVRKKPEWIAAIAVVVFGIVGAILIAPSVPLIIVPDGDAQTVMGGNNPYRIMIGDHELMPLPRAGVSIGLGEVLPDKTSSDYRIHRETGFPVKLDFILTSTLVSKLRVFNESTPCAKPVIDSERSSVWVVHLDCK